MQSSDVVDIVRLLDKNTIDVWIDGGWGVDALLGEQTRAHGDLDIVIRQEDVAKLRELLEARGYRAVERDGNSPWNFVLAQIHRRDDYAAAERAIGTREGRWSGHDLG